MKRRVVVLSSVAVLLGSVSAILVGALLRSRAKPLSVADSTREWLDRHPYSTTLDLGSLRLSAPNGVSGASSTYLGTGLYAYGNGEVLEIEDAAALARLVRKVRGEADGNEFWRVVGDFRLDLLISVPPEPETAKVAFELEAPPSDSRGRSESYWWLDYDLGIGGGGSPRYRGDYSYGGAWRGQSVDAVSWRLFMGNHFTILKKEFVRGGSAFAIHRLEATDERGNRFQLEAMLEPGRLTLVLPSTKVR